MLRVGLALDCINTASQIRHLCAALPRNKPFKVKTLYKTFPVLIYSQKTLLLNIAILQQIKFYVFHPIDDYVAFKPNCALWNATRRAKLTRVQGTEVHFTQCVRIPFIFTVNYISGSPSGISCRSKMHKTNC